MCLSWLVSHTGYVSERWGVESVAVCRLVRCREIWGCGLHTGQLESRSATFPLVVGCIVPLLHLHS